MSTAMAATFEHPFAKALLDAKQPIPPGVRARNAAIPARRFAIYRNNVVAGLGKALQRRFPVVERLVGKEFFAAMARLFVTQQPPRSPLLATYGDEFAGFIAAFEPARETPYLADVARLEAARTRAYHAADAMALDSSQLAAIDADAAGDLHIALHPSVEIVRSPFPIVTIWAMNSGEQELASIEDWRGEDALVARPQLEVEVRALPPGGATFLLALAEGFSLREATGSAITEHSDFDLTRNLAGLISSGLIRDIVLPDSVKRRQP
jgi:hypothetical protein